MDTIKSHTQLDASSIFDDIQMEALELADLAKKWGFIEMVSPIKALACSIENRRVELENALAAI